MSSEGLDRTYPASAYTGSPGGGPKLLSRSYLGMSRGEKPLGLTQTADAMSESRHCSCRKVTKIQCIGASLGLRSPLRRQQIKIHSGNAISLSTLFLLRSHAFGNGEMDYNRVHAALASRRQPVRGKKVLVIGCNTGLDCRHFIDLGAQEVHGVDIIEGIGSDFRDPRVTYHRQSAEQMSLPSDTFDLVYSVATMEHVPDVRAAFREMARVVAPRGLIYSFAAPLWNSRYGHHFPDDFAEYPWAHLRMTEQEMREWLRRKRGEPIDRRGKADKVVDYILAPPYFNRVRASVYLEAGRSLANVVVVKNKTYHGKQRVPAAVLAELRPRGYDERELSAESHTLIALKRPTPRQLLRNVLPASLARRVIAAPESDLN